MSHGTGFGSTYEGLKHRYRSTMTMESMGFGSTYEGLKLRIVSEQHAGWGVLAVPMRA